MTRVTITRKIDVRSAAARPAWRLAMQPWQWHEFPNSSQMTAQVPHRTTGALQSSRMRVDAWNSACADRVTNKFYIARAGGHADYWGNEVISLNVGAATPSWTVERISTVDPHIVKDVPHYLDGRPSSTHLYFALQCVRARSRLFTFYSGSVYQDPGGVSFNKVDAFVLGAGDWDAADTWTAGPANLKGPDRPVCQHYGTEDIYAQAGAGLHRWNQATATWTQVGSSLGGVGGDWLAGSPSAVDPVRGKVLFTIDRYRMTQNEGVVFDIAGGTVTRKVLTGDVSAARESAAAMEYIDTLDTFLLKTRSGAGVYTVNIETGLCAAVPTTGAVPPNSVHGIYNRFRYLPALGGCIYLPTGLGNAYFLATE